jgi:hypothetical protein
MRAATGSQEKVEATVGSGDEFAGVTTEKVEFRDNHHHTMARHACPLS